MSVVRGGGFAGLVTTTTLDAADRAASDAAHLRTAVDRARDAPDPPPRGGADRFDYEVTVDDGSASTVLGAGGVSEALQSLINLVQTSPARRSE